MSTAAGSPHGTHSGPKRTGAKHTGPNAGGNAGASARVAADVPADERLGARRLGVPSLVFMIIAASAPLTVVAGGVPSNFAVTGLLGIPLSFLVLGVVLLHQGLVLGARTEGALGRAAGGTCAACH